MSSLPRTLPAHQASATHAAPRRQAASAGLDGLPYNGHRLRTPEAFPDSMKGKMTREQAWQIVCEFIQNDALRRHSLAVEACVSAYAHKFAAEGKEVDPELWAVTALLHDFDWEIHPQAPDHPVKGELILRERGVPEVIRRAILSHATYTGVPRESLLEKTLFACDELAGFLTAVSYVKPTRSIHEVDVRSVRKKMKDKAFARAVNREDIIHGAAELGVDLDEHIDFCIRAMQARAEELGLQGTWGQPQAAADPAAPTQ